ncbi:hypothetical protein SLS58_002882 [Diplodia intermedia]|uniref:Uncharacterized protein n=1 Tax=Diplodia intermedia TaxID=856260 RepID=A0ABR3TY87_9PEZI
MLPPARGGCSNSSDTQVNFRNLGVVSCSRNSSLYAINNYNGDLTPTQSPITSVWFSWICSQDEEYITDVPVSTCSDGYWQSIRSNAAQWTVYGFDVEYCISESVEDECRLNVAIDLLVVVIVFNAIKFIVITIVVWKVKDSPIITMGDAAASFIRQPDPTTRGMCLVTSADITGRSSSSNGPAYGPIEPQVYRSKKQSRASAASKARWTVSIVLTSIALITILGLLGFAIQTLKTYYGRGDPKSLWDLGIGTVSPYTLIEGWSIPQRGSSALVATVLIANLPQSLLSVLYVVVNGLFTSLSLAREWSAYAHCSRPRALRVSHPRGAQRSTYFLQVPYRLGVPLMCASAFLHWIVSQSIFVAKIDGVGADGEAADDFYHRDTSALTCGYSPLAMLVTVLAAAALALFAAALAARGLPPGMPVAGSCSVAIAAACHAPEGTAETEPVVWGAIPGAEEEKDGVVVGHCAFSNGEVDGPVEGQLYA